MTFDEREVALALAGRVVPVVAPDEAALLPLFAAGYDPADRTRRHGEDPLGFGGAELASALPVVLAMAGTVAHLLVAATADAVQEETRSSVAAVLHRLLHRDAHSSAGAAPAALTADQLARVRTAATGKARQLKLDPDQAQLLADAVVGALAAP